MPLRVSATEAIDKHGADSAAAKRSIDLADTVDVMCDAAHAAARDLLMRTYGEKISVPQVTTHALLAALQTTRLGTTIGLQAEQALTAALHTKLPEPVAGTIATDTKLSAIVASVWAKLLRQCIAEKRLQPVLQRLVNGLIDAQALQPIHTLWLRALFFSGLWLFLLLSGSAAWHVVLSNSRAGDRLDVLAAEFNITYRILMTLLLVLVVIAQLKFIERFLKWRAQRVAHELSASLERTLLDLVVDDEILEFVRFVVDTAVELLIDEIASGTASAATAGIDKTVDSLESATGLDINGDGVIGGGEQALLRTGSDGRDRSGRSSFFYGLVATPLRNAYGAYGGTDRVMEHLNAASRTKLRPAIVIAFSEPLGRSESEVALIKSVVQADDFRASRDLDGSAEASRLERVLVVLNDAINKRAVETGAATVQRVFRARRTSRAASTTIGALSPPLPPSVHQVL